MSDGAGLLKKKKKKRKFKRTLSQTGLLAKATSWRVVGSVRPSLTLLFKMVSQHKKLRRQFSSSFAYSFIFLSFFNCKVRGNITQGCLTVRLYSLWDCPGQNTAVGSLSLLQGIFPTQGSNPGLPHCRWILCQLSHKRSPRILEWVAYPFSGGSSQPRNQTRGLLHCSQILYQLSSQGSP